MKLTRSEWKIMVNMLERVGYRYYDSMEIGSNGNVILSTLPNNLIEEYKIWRQLQRVIKSSEGSTQRLTSSQKRFITTELLSQLESTYNTEEEIENIKSIIRKVGYKGSTNESDIIHRRHVKLLY